MGTSRFRCVRLGGWTIAAALLVASGGLSAGAEAETIDLARASNGATTPFSDLVVDQTTDWSLMTQQLIAAEGPDGCWRFTEPGMGNSLPQAQGQLLNHSGIKDRQRRVVVDILAWVEVNQVLYLDPFEVNQVPAEDLPVPDEVKRPYVSYTGIWGEDPDPEFDFPEPPPEFPPKPPHVPVPEPSTALLGIAGLCGLMIRRR